MNFTDTPPAKLSGYSLLLKIREYPGHLEMKVAVYCGYYIKKYFSKIPEFQPDQLSFQVAHEEAKELVAEAQALSQKDITELSPEEKVLIWDYYNYVAKLPDKDGSAELARLYSSFIQHYTNFDYFARPNPLREFLKDNNIRVITPKQLKTHEFPDLTYPLIREYLTEQGYSVNAANKADALKCDTPWVNVCRADVFAPVA